MISEYLKNFYKETLLDISIFYEMYPESGNIYKDYIPLFQRTNEQLLNPDVQLGESLYLAEKRKVISIERFQSDIKLNDIVISSDKAPRSFRIKIDAMRLRRELDKLDVGGEASKANVKEFYGTILLKDRTLLLEIDGSFWKLNTFRSGSMPLKLMKYLTSTKANQLVSTNELRQNNIELNDSLSETFRSVGFNGLRKSYFLPTLEKSLVLLQTKAKIPSSKIQEVVIDLESVNRI